MVEDLAATCSRLSIMRQGSFLYTGTVAELLHMAEGQIWVCKAEDEETARRLQAQYPITSKQYTENGIKLKLISPVRPTPDSYSSELTLEDAYMCIMFRE